MTFRLGQVSDLSLVWSQSESVSKPSVAELAVRVHKLD